MAKSTKLFDLINSLTPVEKRYFKVFAGQHVLGQENNYTELFDCIDGQDEYDESKIVEMLSNPTFAKNISSGKNYLYGLIMKALRNYYSQKSEYFKFHEAMMDTWILRSKGLEKQYIKALSGAKKSATLRMDNAQRLQVLNLEIKQIWNLKQIDRAAQLRRVNSESDQLLDEIQKEQKLMALSHNLLIDVKRYLRYDAGEAMIFGKVKELLQGRDISSQSNRIKYLYYMLKATYYTLKKDYKSTLENWLAVKAIMESDPAFLKENPFRYLGLLNNMCNNYLLLGKLEQLPAIILQIENIESEHFRLKALKFMTVYYMKLLYYLKKEDYESAYNLSNQMKTGLRMYHKNIVESRQITLSYNMALACFMMKDYDKSLDWLHTLLQIKSKDSQIVQVRAELLQLINFYQLGQYEVVSSMLDTTHRHLKGFTDNAQEMQWVVRTIRRVLNLPPGEVYAVFEELYRKIGDSEYFSEFATWAGMNRRKR